MPRIIHLALVSLSHLINISSSFFHLSDSEPSMIRDVLTCQRYLRILHFFAFCSLYIFVYLYIYCRASWCAGSHRASRWVPGETSAAPLFLLKVCYVVPALSYCHTFRRVHCLFAPQNRLLGGTTVYSFNHRRCSFTRIIN